jgi:hypothetical protein
MGVYINDPLKTHKEWLAKNAIRIHFEDLYATAPDEIALCLFDNGGFTALGVGYDSEEVSRWKLSAPYDERPREYYHAKISEVKKVIPKAAVNFYFKEE